MSPDRQPAGRPDGCPDARSEAKCPAPNMRRTVLARAAMVAVAGLAAGLFPLAPGHGAGIRTVDVVIKNGKVVGKNSVRVSKGDSVVLRWSSDRPLKLHLHGYDVETTVSPGTPAEMKVLARATGRFPVEIHGQGSSGSGHGDGHRTVFHLEVYPD